MSWLYSLRSRLLLSFVVLILISVLSISIFGSIYFGRAIDAEVLSYNMNLLQQVQNNVDTYVWSADNLIRYISQDPAALAYLRNKNSDDATRLTLETNLRNRLSSYVGVDSRMSLGGIVLVRQDGGYISNELYCITRDSLTLEGWYQGAIRTPRQRMIYPRPIGRNLRCWKQYADSDVVMISQAVVDPNNGEPLGVVAIDLTLESLEELLSGLQLDKSGSIFMLDADGEFVLTPVSPAIYRVRTDWFQTDETVDPAPFRATISGEDYLFLFSVSPKTGWKTVTLFPAGVPPQAARTLQNMILIVAAVVLAFGFVAANLITRSVAKPLQGLQRLMQQAETGDLTVRFSYRRNDEIGQLGQRFNTMTAKISQLLSLIVVEQKSKREAELAVLQAQINPHFLYNTMDSIQWMAREYEAYDIVETVGALTQLFRVSLSRGREVITLRDEISHVESYLTIQKVRYEDKITFSIQCDEQLLERPVIKLILQPLVENAIYHGIKPKDSPGHIDIVIDRHEDKLRLRVIDDGVGMTAQKLLNLNRALEEQNEASGYGTFNVDARLRLHFGAGYGLRLCLNDVGGITSELLHPYAEDSAALEQFHQRHTQGKEDAPHVEGDGD